MAPDGGPALRRWADDEYFYSIGLEREGQGLLLRAARARRPEGRSLTLVLRSFDATDRPLLEQILGREGRARTVLAEQVLRCEVVHLDQLAERIG